MTQQYHFLELFIKKRAKKMKSQDIYAPMFIKALCTAAKKGRNKCPSTDE